MVYIHIVTTCPELKQYSIPITDTNNKLAQLNLPLPKIKNISKVLYDIKQENLNKTNTYRRDFELFNRLFLFYKNNIEFKTLITQFPEDEEFPFYDWSYFNHPDLYIDFKENVDNPYIYIYFIIEDKVIPFLNLNDNFYEIMYSYLDNLVPNEKYRNISKIMIQLESGLILNSKQL